MRRTDPEELAELVEAMARFGGTDDGGVERPVYTRQWREAVAELSSRLSRAGFSVRQDPAGNVIGRIEGTCPGADAIVAGSHIDSALQGGRYDGTAGILTAFVAIRDLVADHGPPNFPLEVVAIADEENSRFLGDFWGSRAMTGQLRDDEAHEVTDHESVTVAEAMRECDLQPELLPQAGRRDMAVWLELHIEQGPRLERSGKRIGIVTAVTGMLHGTCVLHGTAAHAGGTPPDARRDPLPAAAEAVLALERLMQETGHDARVTVGKVDVTPNAPNSIASSVTFTFDVRAPDPALYDELKQRVDAILVETAAHRGLEVEIDVWLDHPPVPMSGRVVDAVARAVDLVGAPAIRMASGGGHDSQVFAGVGVAAGMIFVPSRDGISHSPHEFTDIADLAFGTDVLRETLRELAYDPDPETQI